uniref:Amidase domain-containing protein n=1 Tax=Bionectria ochroleuca TaxID=29856 RepID=A0A8H7NGZ5_BIOOC
MAALIVEQLLILDATELAAMLAKRTITSVSLVERLLEQISLHDKPRNLRAVLSKFAPRDTLIKAASQLDDERAQGRLRGPLHGIPILIKDAINTHPSLGMPTTLIKKGLIILAKTNLNEFCNWKGFNSVNGFSVVGGQTNSAYINGGLKDGEAVMGRSPPGSSTGSAVGVSAGYSPIALGTETDESSVKVDGVWTLSHRFDAIGGMAKSVTDLAIITELLHTDQVRSKLPTGGYLSSLSKSFEGLKVGFLDPAIWHLPESLCPQIPSVVQELNEAYEQAIEKVEASGARVEYPVPLPSCDKLTMPDGDMTAMEVVILREYSRNIGQCLGILQDCNVRTAAELIAWNEEHAEIEMPFDNANQQRLIQACKERPTAERYEEARRHMKKVVIEDGFEPLLSGKGLDPIAVPQDSNIASMATASGYPIATMPLGVLKDYGRPFGLAIMARAGREDILFTFMSAFEATFPKRVIPTSLLQPI